MSSSRRCCCTRSSASRPSVLAADARMGSADRPSRFYSFPTYIESTTFGISCDAFGNLKETLTKHKPMVASYLDANYDRVRPPAQVAAFKISRVV